ncbi:hypothetical protein SAZ10_11580 [Mesorhizobium sp. BAC0120]|uniref:hypothetical protein n=1 Tax=Mesorhizobium sp. BAC0120 TaxID=3090670 RepID=UPI00298CF0D0|nr:hypothetical protein [Mesorhizobium sp. BAC0120]MDW6022395.1 hypothetical protein [Mesorhizobium sp. BAC0120]
MRRISLILICTSISSLAGCAGLAAVNSGQQLQAYLDCNTAASKRLATLDGDPVLLAVEAESSCENPRRVLESTYRRLMPDAAGSMIQDLKSAAVGNNAAAIVMARAL